MKVINVFLYEFNHFRKSKAKVITYLIFVFACFYSIYNGFDLQNKQNGISCLNKTSAVQKDPCDPRIVLISGMSAPPPTWPSYTI